jgi:hypothetical protein
MSGSRLIPDSPEDIHTPGWPERRQARIMQELRANGWSLEGLARVYRMPVSSVEWWLARNDYGQQDP